MTIEIKSNHYVIKTDHFYAPEPLTALSTLK